MDIEFFALELLRFVGSTGTAERGPHIGPRWESRVDLWPVGLAVNRVLIGHHRIHLFLLESSAVSRLTCGERSSFSIRSASSKLSSTRKRRSGANLRFTRRASSPRR